METLFSAVLLSTNPRRAMWGGHPSPCKIRLEWLQSLVCKGGREGERERGGGGGERRPPPMAPPSPFKGDDAIVGPLAPHVYHILCSHWLSQYKEPCDHCDHSRDCRVGGTWPGPYSNGSHMLLFPSRPPSKDSLLIISQCHTVHLSNTWPSLEVMDSLAVGCLGWWENWSSNDDSS